MSERRESVEDRFTWNERSGYPEVIVPQCQSCKHKNEGDGWPSCTAFDRIPAEILTNEFDHTKRYPGDGGIRYEPKE
jgi:hypothetical protein